MNKYTNPFVKRMKKWGFELEDTIRINIKENYLSMTSSKGVIRVWRHMETQIAVEEVCDFNMHRWILLMPGAIVYPDRSLHTVIKKIEEWHARQQHKPQSVYLY